MADPARIIAFKQHAGLPGKWRARAIRFGSYALEVELPCVNGLSAWFTIGTLHAAEDVERLMTDGGRLEASEYAERIAAALSVSDRTIELILRDVAELPDRTSPGDAPEMMLVSIEELDAILRRRLVKDTA